MKEISITSRFTVYDAVLELPNDIQDLMEHMRKKHAPYSKFSVGVAILIRQWTNCFGIK
jgi:cytidine deaminase